MPADIIINGKRLRSPKEKRKEAVLKKYRDAVEHYLATGKKVILVYPIPEVGWEVPVVLGQHFRSDIEKNSMNLSTSYDVYKHRNKEVISMFDSIKGKNLIRIKPDEIFCDTYIKDRCVAAYRDKVFYRDGDHLSKTGAAILANKIAEKFKGSK